jgi:hypothetical protein
MKHSSLASCLACLLLVLVLGQAAASTSSRRDILLQGTGTTGRKLLDGMPVHGNWCGPGHGKPGAPAVDDLDACCRAHDKCYGNVKYFDCHCDMKLVECAYFNTKAGPWELTKRAKRKAIQIYFNNAAQMNGCRDEAKAQATRLKLLP